MSRIYFHSPSGTAEIRGSERAWFGCLTNDVGIAPLRGDLLRLYDCIDWGRDRGTPSRDERMIDLWLKVDKSCAHFMLDDERANCWDTILNTCLTIGSDAFCLATRLHAQCEIHAWVEGKDRAWLASVIKQGREEGLMREDQGWPELVTFLLARDDEPVVTSYSVCDSFPNRRAAKWTSPTNDPDGAAWYELPKEEQWSLALAGVQHMRFGPETLRHRFGTGKTAFDVLDALWKGKTK